MATNPLQPGSAPVQPDLRAFIVYNHVPAGCIIVPVTDEASFPILRPGDFVVVDTKQTDPDRDLFVIEFGSETASRHIVELFSRAGRFGSGPNREMIDTTCWFTGYYNRPRSRDETEQWLRDGRARRLSMFCDGPYATEGRNAGYLKSKLVGRVVGVFEGSAVEPQRVLS